MKRTLLGLLLLASSAQAQTLYQVPYGNPYNRGGSVYQGGHGETYYETNTYNNPYGDGPVLQRNGSGSPLYCSNVTGSCY